MVEEKLFKFIFFFLVILGCFFEIAGDIFFKKWSIDGRNILIILGLILYAIGSVFWAFSLKYEFLSKAVSVFMIINIIVVALAGVLFFKENLSLINKIGILLGIISVFLIEI